MEQQQEVNTMKKTNTFKLTMTAIFTAIIVAVQLLGGSIKIGTVSISLVLIPIVIGSLLLGAKIGAFLGAVFGVVTIIGGITAMDPFTAILLNSSLWSAVCTVVMCLLKGMAAGFVPAVVYKLLNNKNKYLAVITASALAPICNTGIFVLGTLTVLSTTISENFVSSGTTLLYFILIGCAGINFLVELAVNLIVSPAIYSFVNTFQKRKI